MSKKDLTQVARKYTASDLYDAHSLAESDLSWMATALESLRKEIKRVKTHMIETGHYYDQLGQLEKLADMYSYLADDRCNTHAGLAAEFDLEVNAEIKLLGNKVG